MRFSAEITAWEPCRCTPRGSRRLVLRAHHEEGDALRAQQYGWKGRTLGLIDSAAVVHSNVLGGKIHNDHIALACLLHFLPFVKSHSVTFPFPVSAKFAQAVRELKGGVMFGVGGESFGPLVPSVPVPAIQVANEDPGVAPYDEGYRAAICFTGGADSVACTAIIPDAFLVHCLCPLRRRMGRVETLKDIMASTGHEHLLASSTHRNKHPGDTYASTYPEISVSAVLAAQANGVNAIAFGGTMATTYMQHGYEFVERSTFVDAKLDKLDRLFAAAGLPLIDPVGGYTEISTLRLALTQTPLDKLVWCLGSQQRPCGRCVKCWRKALFLAYLGEIDAGAVDWEQFKKPLESLRNWVPFYTQNFVLGELDGLPQWMRDQAARFPASPWADSVYGHHYTSSAWAGSALHAARALSLRREMSAEHVAVLRAWSLDPDRVAPIP